MKHNIAFATVLSLAAAIGCSPAPSDSPSDRKPVTMDSAPPELPHAHSHAEHGPNGGELIEIGEEEYHAELVHDATSVTIYLLDASAKSAVPIEATELTINLLHEGKPEQFKLAAQAQSSDPSGKFSKFASTDAELASHVDDPAAAAKLSLTIAGKPYRADLAHSHDHAGHDHDGHDHKH